MSVSDDTPNLPMVKLDSTHLEIQMNTNNLKLKELRDENAKSVAMRTIDPNKRNGSIALMQQNSTDILYKVGDIIMYGANIHGYVIKVDTDEIQVVSEHGKVAFVVNNQVSKKVLMDRKKFARD